MTDKSYVFRSIRQTARETGLSECFLRKLYHAGRLPHVMAGVKVLVNIPALLRQLEKEGVSSDD